LSVAGIVGLIALLTGMPKEALILGVVMVLSLIVLYYTLIETKHARSRKVEKIEIFE
jgi:hypothetical protein